MLLCVCVCGEHLMWGTLCSSNRLGAEGAKALAPALGLLTGLGTLVLK
jgi:hypothetical protein